MVLDGAQHGLTLCVFVYPVGSGVNALQFRIVDYHHAVRQKNNATHLRFEVNYLMYASLYDRSFLFFLHDTLLNHL